MGQYKIECSRLMHMVTRGHWLHPLKRPTDLIPKVNPKIFFLPQTICYRRLGTIRYNLLRKPWLPLNWHKRDPSHWRRGFEPKEKKGFTLAFILGMMVMVGVIGAILIGFHF